MKFNPIVNLEINGKVYSYKLLESLKLLNQTKSQRKTAKKLNISHSVLNRRIKNAEEKLGLKLVEIKNSKTYLSKESIEILKKYHSYQNRLAEDEKIAIVGGHIITGLLDSISKELPFNIDVYSSNDIAGYKLAKHGPIDILALDDPLIAFINDLDFTPIAYDHLVLVSNNEEDKIKNMSDLKDLKFVSVHGTAQRLAWSTLYNNKIPFEIVNEVKSEFDAFKIVENSQDLYTFLNASYFKGNEVLKNETKHVISLVQFNEEKKQSKDFIEYILNEGQELIAKQGFIPIKPWKVQKQARS